MNRTKIILALCFCLLIAAPVLAQSTIATVTGTVTDSSRANIAGASVIAENINTGVKTTVTTNDSGIYLFASLIPGTYRITAEKTGFRRTVYSDVKLELSARLTIDFSLEVGQLTEQVVEVNAAVDARLSLGASSVGGVLTDKRVQDLPVPGRNALSLIETQGGVVGDYFSGARIGTLNIQRDGINVMDQRINSGVSSTIFNSVDLVEEVRIVTSPADAEFGRGSGQVLINTRSGTNEFHGSLFEAHRNTALNANTWFNNQRGRDANGAEFSPREVLIRNQFGGRLGGPIWKNKSFFHVLYEGQRIASKDTVTRTVLTQSARQGLFRFYPGVQNGNAIAAVPTVDLNGNPIKPVTATGELQTVNLYGRDPNRPALNSIIQEQLSSAPLPNNFRAGDGLNTAGFTWNLSESQNFDHFSLKLNHNINEANWLAFSFTRESGLNKNAFLEQVFPDSPGGNSNSLDYLYSLALTSTLRPNLINEFRVGALRPKLRFNAPWEVAGLDALPQANGQPYVIDFVTITDPIDQSNDPQGRISPFYQFADTVTWQKGRHSFKGGVEVRFVSTNGFNSFDVLPRVNIGSGGAAVQNINNISGIGNNNTTATNILNNLTGSVASVDQAFNSPGGRNPQFLAGEGKQRTWQQREFSWFFKDDLKATRNLTLNLGLRYEFYGVPYEANGKTVGLVGGSKSIFGISGTSLNDIFRPGVLNGSMTNLEPVGKNSINEKTKLYNNDWNNFAPAVGLSWAIPWFGENKTVLRAGYGIGYERNSLRLLDVLAGDQPGLRTLRNFTQSAYLGISAVPLPLTPIGAPLETVPLTERTQTIRVYDTNLRTPYVQNWSVVVQRELFKDSVIEVRYVGNKGTKLVRGYDINEVNIFSTGILEAFKAVQAGGSHPLFEQIFRGLNLGLGTINGTTVTAGASLRRNGNTDDFFAMGDVGEFVSFLNNTSNFTGVRGGLLRRAGLAENFILANPQFAAARLTTNTAGSTYHSLQLDFNKRFSRGLLIQANYTFSKALGEEEGDGQEMNDAYRTLTNLRIDKRRLEFDNTHVFRSSGLYELPFGPGRKFLSSSNKFVSRLVELWQVGVIFNIFSGDPISLTAERSTLNQFTDNTPTLVGKLSGGFGQVKVGPNGVTYFDGFKQVKDPAVDALTTDQDLRTLSSLKAITDASGNLILINPTPGTLGTLAARYLEGPGEYRLDLNMVKRFRIGESKNIELRADFINAFNTPQWNNPTAANLEINSINFGSITSTRNDTNRIIVLGARINF
jgi:Carboxypeptidase regulatory-like domain